MVTYDGERPQSVHIHRKAALERLDRQGGHFRLPQVAGALPGPSPRADNSCIRCITARARRFSAFKRQPVDVENLTSGAIFG